jgi:hypothetical protein
MVKAWRTANDMDCELMKLGYGTTPYFYIAGDIADAIYYAVGEHSDDFDKSVTFNVLENKSLTNEECTNILMFEYNKHFHPDAITENTIESLREAAQSKNLDIQSMILLILNEWVMRSELTKALMK